MKWAGFGFAQIKACVLGSILAKQRKKSEPVGPITFFASTSRLKTATCST
jgi:hypothetical protein